MSFYTIKELQMVMGLSHNTVYKIVKLKGFPMIKIGSKILIPKDEFNKWVKDNLGTTINV